MRWFASLVVLCLLAAGTVRPRVEIREPYAAEKLSAADALVALVMPRRGGAVTPDLRHAPIAIAAIATTPVEPPRTAVPAPRAQLPLPVPSPGVTCSARGPPNA